MKDIKELLVNEDFGSKINSGFNTTFHKEQMEELADELKSAGYSDKIVKMFKNYSSQYVTPGFIAQILLELKNK